MGLEDIIYSNVEIRNFLKLFSEQHWNRMCKATLLLGIYRLDELSQRYGDKGLLNMTPEEVEELVIAVHKKRKNRARKHQNHIQKPQMFAETSQSDIRTSSKKPQSSSHHNLMHNQMSQTLETVDQGEPIYVAKAPSGWRRGGDSADSRNPNLPRYQVDNPHNEKRAKSHEGRPRSQSINRVVYPEWWGEESPDRDADQGRGSDRRFGRVAKRLRSADVNKAKINKNVARHCEDNLDRRLREVHEGNRQQQYQRQQHVQAGEPRYFYTNQA